MQTTQSFLGRRSERARVGSDGTTRRTVLRHVRLSPAYDGGSKNALVQAKLTWQTIDAGLILHYQDPENFGVALLDWTSGSTVTPRYVEFKDGKKQATRATGTRFALPKRRARDRCASEQAGDGLTGLHAFGQ